ncbi:hypothetical protein Fcan01_06257 [Folsomia candida]|uniref:Uncharacterized protein n=1 Tax=Folsomia candida TaxID=158441 RepID=A0A226ET19_FOLCA|nr:hypothetical protein Fcan01_06257 [Folsomia candida]
MRASQPHVNRESTPLSLLKPTPPPPPPSTSSYQAQEEKRWRKGTAALELSPTKTEEITQEEDDGEEEEEGTRSIFLSLIIFALSMNYGESTQHKSGPLVGRSVVSFVALLDDDGELEWKVGTAFSNVKWQWRQPAARVEDVRSYEVEIGMKECLLQPRRLILLLLDWPYDIPLFDACTYPSRPWRLVGELSLGILNGGWSSTTTNNFLPAQNLILLKEIPPLNYNGSILAGGRLIHLLRSGTEPEPPRLPTREEHGVTGRMEENVDTGMPTKFDDLTAVSTYVRQDPSLCFLIILGRKCVDGIVAGGWMLVWACGEWLRDLMRWRGCCEAIQFSNCSFHSRGCVTRILQLSEFPCDAASSPKNGWPSGVWFG